MHVIGVESELVRCRASLAAVHAQSAERGGGGGLQLATRVDQRPRLLVGSGLGSVSNVSANSRRWRDPRLFVIYFSGFFALDNILIHFSFILYDTLGSRRSYTSIHDHVYIYLTKRFRFFFDAVVRLGLYLP